MSRRRAAPVPSFGCLQRGVYTLPFTTPGGARLMVAVTATGALATEPIHFRTYQAGHAATRKLWRELDRVDPPPLRIERRASGRDRRRLDLGPPARHA